MCVTTHSKPKEDWCEWWTKMAANLNVFKPSKKDSILSKSNISFAKVHWVMYRIRQEPADTTAARDKLEHTEHAQTQI